eukprot:TRINITY_DN11103_c0_g1_i5.p1 TRINITY_DN11103_c0_g1~~TRINITY_DN11103_c0_g1_i5.p1  ORF type:complete len:118 (+),score=2.37 TRINITY_DN11103_c0_g1_i5:130-483(+)
MLNYYLFLLMKTDCTSSIFGGKSSILFIGEITLAPFLKFTSVISFKYLSMPFPLLSTAPSSSSLRPLAASSTIPTISLFAVCSASSRGVNPRVFFAVGSAPSEIKWLTTSLCWLYTA